MEQPTPRIRIVLLDDHAEARDALERRARRHPRLDVVGATESLETALKLIDEQRPDAVLVDTKRADHRGAEALALLSRLDASLRPCIVVYVALLTPLEEEAAGRLGADAVLLKQLSTATLADQLIAVLTAAAARGSATSEARMYYR